MSGLPAIDLPTPPGAGGPYDEIVYRSRTTPESSLNFAFFDSDGFDVVSSPLGERVDVLSDLVLHEGFTVRWDFGGAYVACCRTADVTSGLLWHAWKHESHGSLRHLWPNGASSALSTYLSASAGSRSRTSTGGSGVAFSLDRCVGVDSEKVVAAFTALQGWAEDRGLTPSEVEYRDLQFTAGADSDAERAYRTHWASAEIPEPVVARPRRPDGSSSFLRIARGRARPAATPVTFFSWTGLCALLDCADLGHLEFLPSGDAALTRRAKKASRLSAVVVRWSVRRKRYERQGILAESAAIEQAAQQCLSDADVRARRRERDTIRRADQDLGFRDEFAAAIREQFPGCPTMRADAIALHAAARGSGRVGRSAAGRALEPEAVRLAVVASVRHVDTDYDDLLMAGAERESARAQVRRRVEDILNAWRDGAAPLDVL